MRLIFCSSGHMPTLQIGYMVSGVTATALMTFSDILNRLPLPLLYLPMLIIKQEFGASQRQLLMYIGNLNLIMIIKTTD